MGNYTVEQKWLSLLFINRQTSGKYLNSNYVEWA